MRLPRVYRCDIHWRGNHILFRLGCRVPRSGHLPSTELEASRSETITMEDHDMPEIEVSLTTRGTL
jgi:hypothetical protein